MLKIDLTTGGSGKCNTRRWWQHDNYWNIHWRTASVPQCMAARQLSVPQMLQHNLAVTNNSVDTLWYQYQAYPRCSKYLFIYVFPLAVNYQW